MYMDEFRTYCMNKKGVTESFPFNQSVIVFKVMNKMFALGNIDLFEGMNLKCDPEKAIQLREEYPNLIKPGYHMSKTHWNTVSTQGLDIKLQKKLIDHSYDLVVSSLSKRVQAELDLL